MRRSTAVSSVVGALIALVGAAAPAMAVDNWGPTNAYYKGNLVASASGYFNNDRGQYAANRIKVTDRRNDGNTVYGRTRFQFYYVCDSSYSSAAWCTTSTQTTPETTGTVEVYLRKTLDSRSDQARGRSQACAQLSFPVPDACSAEAYVTFRY